MERTLFIEDLSEERIAEIEWRMRSGRWSRAGFLGADESLRDVIRNDADTLRRLGLTCELLATRLRELVAEGMQAEGLLDSDELEWDGRPGRMKRRPRTMRPVRENQRPMDSGEVGYFRFLLESTRPLRLDSGFGFSCLAYRGEQDCPFSEEQPGMLPCGTGGCDILITNPRRNNWIVFSGLLPHLIEAHHFFEGWGTVYRLDPELTARVLELGPFQQAPSTYL